MKTRLRSAALSPLLALAIAGCTAGGPDSPAPSTPAPPPASPSLVILPTTFDFGKVTSGNVPAPLEITIGNGGNAPLTVSNITLGASSGSGFQVRVDGGAKSCGTASPTIAAGASCTVQVVFQPDSSGTFNSTLQVTSNDPTPPAGLPITGTAEPVSTLTVRINQLQTSCPSNEVTAYVSVTDQGGYAVPGLLQTNFSVTQEGSARPVLSLSYVDIAYQPIATAGALDFSNSLTSQPVAFGDMKNAVSGYFSAMRTGDIGEVVKFGSEVEVTQAFTSDKASLLAAIAAPFDKGSTTKLYDAAIRAVDDAAVSTSYRRAVIVTTDGADNASASTLAAVTSNAVSKKVPIFAIGIGASINRSVLQQMAEGTGGLYYEANTSQNLATIYQQLSSILYQKQYVLRFDQASTGTAGSSSSITIGASSAAGLTGNASSPIASCN